MDINKEYESFTFVQKTKSNKRKFDDNPNEICKENELTSNNTFANHKTAEDSNLLGNEFKQNIDKVEDFNSINPKPKIFRIKKVPKIFETHKLGRPPKHKIKNKDLRKGRFRQVNVNPKIFNAGKKSMHNFISRYVNVEDFDLQEPDINENGQNNHSYWKQMSNKTPYEIYCNTIPKRFEGDTLIEEKKGEIRNQKRKELYSKINKNKKQIDAILGIKKYEIVFKGLLFKDFMIPYLNNKTRIDKYHEKYGLIELDLKGFETYSQFNNYDYTKTKKEEYKKHVLDIINGKAKNRKRTKKTKKFE